MVFWKNNAAPRRQNPRIWESEYPLGKHIMLQTLLKSETQWNVAVRMLAYIVSP